jgi:hypothetical protein
MKIKNLLSTLDDQLAGFAQKLLPSAWFSPFESANPSHRRGQVPGASPGDMKRDLSPGVRSELVKRSRYLQKNSGFVRELVGSMAIYSTGDGIKPQAQTADTEWNRRAEELFATWAARCEVTGRFSFEECQSLVCRGIDVDGEYFPHKTRNRAGRPALQLIESHRIGDAEGREDTVDGIGLDPFGAPLFYRVLIDDGTFRDVPAASVLHVFEPESISAVRNPATIQHSINDVLDEMELLALEKHAVKDNADVARVLKRLRDEVDGDGDQRDAGPGYASGGRHVERSPEKAGGAEAGREPGQFRVQTPQPHVHRVPRSSAARFRPGRVAVRFRDGRHADKPACFINAWLSLCNALCVSGRGRLSHIRAIRQRMTNPLTRK